LYPVVIVSVVLIGHPRSTAEKYKVPDSEPVCWSLTLYSARGMLEQESEAAKAVVGAEKLTRPLVRMCEPAGREKG
jgi:hypothetical protein